MEWAFGQLLLLSSDSQSPKERPAIWVVSLGLWGLKPSLFQPRWPLIIRSSGLSY